MARDYHPELQTGTGRTFVQNNMTTAYSDSFDVALLQWTSPVPRSKSYQDEEFILETFGSVSSYTTVVTSDALPSRRLVGFPVFDNDATKDANSENDDVSVDENSNEHTGEAELAVKKGLSWFVGGNPYRCHCGTKDGTRCLNAVMMGSHVCPKHNGILLGGTFGK